MNTTAKAALNEYGTLQAFDEHLVLRFERHFDHLPEAVWRVLTESSELVHWFPADLKGPRAKGAAIRIVSVTGQFPPTEGKFTLYESPRLLEYTWGKEILRWELQPDSVGCAMVFTNVLDEHAETAGPADIAAAWHACLDVLNFVLAGRRPPYSTTDRIPQLKADVNGYRDQCGPARG